MHLRLLAVGDRQPAWVEDAFDTYVARFPREWRFRLECVRTAKRSKNSPVGRAIDEEADSLLSRVKSDEQLVLLDEQGTALSSQALSGRLSKWRSDGRDLAFIIGGPDGVSESIRRRANFVWSLSSLTLPHGLARVLLAEQLYRAWSLETGHPYHRE